MILIDYLLLAVIALSALMGIFRGFVKEALSLLAWIAGVWGAWRFGSALSGWFPEFLGDGMARVWAARLAILILVLILGGVISGGIALLLGRTGLNGTDRFVGMIFGLGRGVVLAGLAVSALEFAGFAADPWWSESKLIPYAAPIAESLRDIADQGIELLQDSAGEAGAGVPGMEG